MADMEQVRAEAEARLKIRQHIAEVQGFKEKCPLCQYPVKIQEVKKAGVNRGRQFTACPCGCFEWQDQPKCKVCGRRTFKAVIKKAGRNQGREFEACPNRCQFKFLDE